MATSLKPDGYSSGPVAAEGSAESVDGFSGSLAAAASALEGWSSMASVRLPSGEGGLGDVAGPGDLRAIAGGSIGGTWVLDGGLYSFASAQREEDEFRIQWGVSVLIERHRRSGARYLIYS